ncbi:Hypothetical protein R9X50_00002800 [Acrodontium crateriforme]|uniref:mRNA-capping enzyme subunit beta n=1 Tax=Acrodontium crateriforme TaxID=150365 RepID=A0AAQ3M2K7_9PEZI|nr:Hypothetical protein R9X50_00002800 [Acrodontium crateriforme]
MDLNSIMNSGPAPEKRREPPTPAAGSEGQGHYPPSFSHQHSSSGSAPSHGRVMTPLVTPSKNSQGRYFPSQGQNQPPPQSPAFSQQGQQYPPHTPHAASTPGPRPLSNGYQQSHPSPSQFQPPSHPSGLHHHGPPHHPSHSPTPPVRKSPNIQSTGMSPLAAMPGQSSAPMHAPGYYQPHSQPGTPLAPPPPMSQHRSSGQSYQDVGSPYHARTMSGASNGVVLGSPAQRNASIGNLVGSPGTLSRQPSNMRRSSEYQSQHERERSQSVSPKTMVPQRRPSLVSRHSSSMQDPQSARSSVQPTYTPSSEGQNNMGGARPLTYAQNATDKLNVAQHTQMASHSVHSSQPSQPLAANLGPQASDKGSSQGGQPQIHHQSHSMGFNQLLTPTKDNTPPINAHMMAVPPEVKNANSKIFMKASPTPKKLGVATPPPAAPSEWQQRQGNQSGLALPPSKPTAKRTMDSDPTIEPPTKRGKMRKYTERPVWARLARTNPRIDELQSGEGRTQVPPSRQSQLPAKFAPPPAPAQQQMPPNGMHVNGNVASVDPWLQNPPLDQDLIHARSVLGSWEKSARWNTPYPDLLKAVQDWLYSQLVNLQEIGNSPDEGAIEIEAKIGQIKTKDSENRVYVPVMNAVVLESGWFSKNCRFESQMDERAFRVMNSYLNTTLTESMKPGRVPMQYAHPKEVDSFRKLSNMGYQALPPAVQRHRNLDRKLNLRTSTVIETREVKARIVKVKINDLHIYNPTGEYDCRISINIEVNLNRADLHPNDMEEEPTGDAPAPPDRKKDRLSYKHLEYSFDLTKVEQAGMQPKYELELEVNAAALREQMKRMANGESHAFGDVVSGFVDNATFLMRLRPDAVPVKI